MSNVSLVMPACALMVLFAAASVAARQTNGGQAGGEPPVMVDRPGGLLPCEDMPGEARSARHPGPLLVPRADGQPTALFFDHEIGGENPGPRLVYAELITGRVRIEALPGKFSNPWSQLWGPDGRLYFGLWGPATLLRYDPATDHVDSLGVIEPEGNHVPILTIGTDEKIYALSGVKGHVFSMDPKTDQVVRYGQQGPKREYPIAYSGSLGVDDEYIYSTFGNVPSEVFTVAMNKETREQTLLKDLTGARFRQERQGVTASLAGKEYWMYKGKAIPKASQNEKPPWPARPLTERKPAPALKGNVEFLKNSVWREMDGTTHIWYRLDPKMPWQALTYKVSGRPVTLRRIALLPDGHLMASSAGYDGIYTFDPKTRKLEHVGVNDQSHYSTLVLGDKVWLAGYPGGSGLYVWDPSKQWTVLKGTPAFAAPDDTAAESNPRRLAGWAKPGNFQFPLFLVQGRDKALYAGIHGERGNVGGLLSWRELDIGQTGYLREPFELYDVAGLCTALNGSKIVYSSFAVRGVKGEPRPASGRLFVFDVATRRLDWSIDPLEGIDCTGAVVEYKPGKLILATDDRRDWDIDRWKGTFKGSVLYKVDMETRQVTQRVELPGQLANRREYYWLNDFRQGPDGMIYTLYDDTLVRIDPETLAIMRISKIGDPGPLAFVGNDVYLAGSPHVRRVGHAVER